MLRSDQRAGRRLGTARVEETRAVGAFDEDHRGGLGPNEREHIRHALGVFARSTDGSRRTRGSRRTGFTSRAHLAIDTITDGLVSLILHSENEAALRAFARRRISRQYPDLGVVGRAPEEHRERNYTRPAIHS